MKKSLKEQYLQETQQFAQGFLKKLPHTDEDKEKIDKIVRFYFRKRTIQSGRARNLAAAIIWLYGRINFMQESEGKQWTQDSVAKVCGVSKSTISAKASALMKELDIELLDQRFARQKMVEKNPLMQISVDPRTGMIFNNDDDIPGQFGVPMMKDKEDYYYDAMEYLTMGDMTGAIRLCKKAIDIDEHFVAGYLGLAWVYQQKGNRKKYEEYVHIAFEETKKVFPKWPKTMLWGILGNRQFMRAIQGKASVWWEAGKVQEAEKLFRLLLKMNQGDNQGIRYMIAGMFAGISGEEVDEMIDRGNEKQNWDESENLVAEQNTLHKFWEPPEEEL